MKKRRGNVIAICSSASFYKDVLRVAADLRKYGFVPVVPLTASKMARNNDFNVKRYKTWFRDPADYKIKTFLMKEHFKEIIASDVVLILNLTKHEMKGYIGGNVLMEMAIAFHYKKSIYIYNNISSKSQFKEEILGMHPVFIDGDLSKIK